MKHMSVELCSSIFAISPDVPLSVPTFALQPLTLEICRLTFQVMQLLDGSLTRTTSDIVLYCEVSCLSTRNDHDYFLCFTQVQNLQMDHKVQEMITVCSLVTLVGIVNQLFGVKLFIIGSVALVTSFIALCIYQKTGCKINFQFT